jgi:hypothetical protein
MQCPTCGQHSPESWQWLFRDKRTRAVLRVGETAPDVGPAIELSGPRKTGSTVAVSWMRCANGECDELIIRIHERRHVFHGPVPIAQDEVWIARPRTGASRAIDPLVPDGYRRDFAEAADILDRSPRMSAVLSRRILADLLEGYARKTQYNLADRIDSFNDDTTHPKSIRENLHYLREIADLSAHTKKNDQAEIIDVERVEAEWTLALIDRLFDYFIVSPAKDASVRAAVDQKVQDAGRKPIKPLPEDRRK